ncbi:MAG: Npt1/Npt2 family nucleotide transporter, partial [Candidatus Babeliales bacterium]
MGTKIRQWLSGIFDIEPHERLKVLCLAITFFLVIGAYTVTRDLKNAIFVSIVGKEYIPWAKVVSMLVLIPAIFIYAKFVDDLRRYQLLAFYSLFFGIVSLIFTFFIGHPSIGIGNTDTSPYRLFGWLFYFFVEGYSPFVVSVFWAFANSVTSPEGAKRSYGFIVSGSKLGGMLSAGIAWILFSRSSRALPGDFFSEIITHQVIMAVSSIMLLLVPVIIFFLVKKVPGRYLHGYEAVYQMEKKKKKEVQETGVLAGLKLFIKYPYVLGIFS